MFQALTGTVVNAGAVIIGALAGLLLNQKLPKRFSDEIMKALGLCTMFIGITGILKGEKTLVLILSMVVGTLIGTLLDLDKRINQLGKFIERKLKKEGSESRVAEAFVASSLLFCVGAMSIVGPLQSGLENNHTTLYAKSLMDGIAAAVFASGLGFGVMFSSVLIIVYQGSIALLAQFIAPYLNDIVVAEMTGVGSLILIGLALNMLGITKLKVMNFIPAIFLPILFCLFM